MDDGFICSGGGGAGGGASLVIPKSGCCPRLSQVVVSKSGVDYRPDTYERSGDLVHHDCAPVA